MAEQEYHEMVLDAIHPSGVEEWYCPTCGRRFLMQWPPAYNKVILETGDETAIHSGGKGDVSGMSIEISQIASSAEAEITQAEEEALQPFFEWMDKVNFEALWNRETGVEG